MVGEVRSHIARTVGQTMDHLPINSVDAALSYLLLLVSLIIVPTMLTWWIVAQQINGRMRSTGSQLDRGRWHFLQFGPAAPLISAAASLCGFVMFYVPHLHDALSPDVRFAFLILGGIGLVAFMMSMVLWSYSNAPPREECRRREERCASARRVETAIDPQKIPLAGGEPRYRR